MKDRDFEDTGGNQWADPAPERKENLWVTLWEDIVDWWDCDYDSPVRHIKRIILGAGLLVGIIGVGMIMMFSPKWVVLVAIIAGAGYAIGMLLEDW